MPTVLRYAGIAEEVSFNPTTPPAAEVHLDISSASLDVPTDPELSYNGGLGRGMRKHRPGYYVPAGNVVYAVDIKTIAFLLKWALGGYVYTAPTNLVTNPGFETNTTGWTTGGTNVLSRVASDGVVLPRAGSWMAKAAYSNHATLFSYAATLTAAAHEAYVWLYIPTSFSGTQITVAFNSYAGATGTLTKDANMALRDRWQRVTVGDATIVGGDLAGFLLVTTTGTPDAADAVYLDDAHIHLAASDHLHEFYGTKNNILPSFTSRIGKDDFEHVFTGCVVNSLGIEVSDGFVTATVDIIGAHDYKASITLEASLIMADEYPLAFHEVTATRDAADISAIVRNFTLTINNNISSDNGRSIGSRFARRLVAGERAITVDGELWFEDTDQLETFWGGASGPVVAGTTEFAMEFIFDAGSDGNLSVSLPRCIYVNTQQQASGRDPILPSFSLAAYNADHTLADTLTVVESEILCTLTNEQQEVAAAA